MKKNLLKQNTGVSDIKRHHLPTFEDFMADSKYPHEIKSEAYWKKILAGDSYAMAILNTVFLKQKGMASDRQMEIMRRVERGDNSRYSTKN